MLVLFLLVSLILHVAQKSLRSTGLYQILRLRTKGFHAGSFLARVVDSTRRSKITSQHRPLSNFSVGQISGYKKRAETSALFAFRTLKVYLTFGPQVLALSSPFMQ